MEPNKKLKVAIVDDHFAFPLALKTMVGKYDFLEFAGIFTDGKMLIDQLDEVKPDIVLMDIEMPVMSGDEATRIVMKKYPSTKVVAVSIYDDGNSVKKMLDAGAWSYITKGCSQKEYDTLFDSLRDNKKFISPRAALNYTLLVSENAPKNNEKTSEQAIDPSIPKIKITKREKEIIEYISNGFSDKEIAKTLNISHRTIDAHKQNMMGKLGTRKAAEIVSIAYRLKLI